MAGAAADPKLELPKVAQAADALAKDADDLGALLALSRGLVTLGDRELGARGYGVLARLAGELGQLALALLSTKELTPLDPALAQKVVGELAGDYGSGSARVDAELRSLPPPPPRARPGAVAGVTADEVKKKAGAALAAAEKELTTRKPARAKLPAFPLFRALDAKAFVRLIELMKPKQFPAGAVVIEQGSAAEAFYVVARGRVRIERSEQGKDVVLSRLGPGAFFGEMALLGDTARTARATADSDSELFEIARAPLEKLAGESPKLAEILAEHCRDRLIANLMITSALFRELSPEDRRALSGKFARRVHPAASKIIQEGAEGDGIYVVVSGSAEVRKKDASGDRVLLTTLRPGDIFGEMSVLGRRPAQAGINAIDKTATLFLPREAFDEVVKQFPQILSHLYQLQVTRERDNERLLAAEPIEADDYLI